MNVVGTIVLFQAVCALLRRSACPRFVTVSSSGGCIAGEMIQVPVGTVAYGSSKAALNWATRKMHFENEWLGESHPSDTMSHSPLTACASAPLAQ